MISLNRLIDGGALILIIFIVNHQKENIGNMFIIPLVKKILRVKVKEYKILVRKNREDEQTP